MRLPQKGWSLFYIGCRRVVGRLRQSSASLHPPSGTSFLREPLTRPRPATLCRSLPATTQLFPGAVRAEKNRRCHFLVTKRPNDSFAVVTDIVAEEVNIQCRPSCEFLVGDIKQFAPDRFSVIFDRFFSHSLTSRYFSRVVFTLRSFA